MYTIAIDLGGTVVKIGLLSDGEIVDCVRLPSRLALGLAPNLPKDKGGDRSVVGRLAY